MDSGKHRNGTTLVEILVVVAVVMILAGLVAFGLSFPYAKEVAGGLAIAAGVMIVMDA